MARLSPSSSRMKDPITETNIRASGEIEDAYRGPLTQVPHAVTAITIPDPVIPCNHIHMLQIVTLFLDKSLLRIYLKNDR